MQSVAFSSTSGWGEHRAAGRVSRACTGAGNPELEAEYGAEGVPGDGLSYPIDLVVQRGVSRRRGSDELGWRGWPELGGSVDFRRVEWRNGAPEEPAGRAVKWRSRRG